MERRKEAIIAWNNVQNCLVLSIMLTVLLLKFLAFSVPLWEKAAWNVQVIHIKGLSMCPVYKFLD